MISMVGESEEFWDDVLSPPKPKTKGGFGKVVVGHVKPSKTSVQGLKDLQDMRGVNTELVKKDGEDVLEVSLNAMVLPNVGTKKKKA